MLACMNALDTILTGDCLTVLPMLPAGSADLVFIDPPFNIGLSYPGYDDRRPTNEYLARLEEVFRAVLRVLSPSGSLWVQCGQNMQAEACVMLKRLGIHWRNSAIWHFTFGQHQAKRFVPSHQVIHGFTVHPKRFTFDADAMREPSLR